MDAPLLLNVQNVFFMMDRGVQILDADAVYIYTDGFLDTESEHEHSHHRIHSRTVPW